MLYITSADKNNISTRVQGSILKRENVTCNII